MKINKILLTLAALASIGLASCSDDFTDPPIVLPDGGIGTGKWNNPMTVYQAKLGTVNDSLSQVWVKGYIVGYIDTSDGSTLNATRARIGENAENATVNTNMLMASDSTETDWQNCISVQLPSGANRNALNLVDNPGNLYKEVCIYGTTGSKYCGVYGVKAVSEFNWGPIGIQTEPEGPLTPLGDFTENFESSNKFSTYTAQGWKNIEILGGLSGWYLDEYGGNNYVTVSSYRGSETGGPYENWFVSPPINVDELSQKIVSFQTRAAYKAENSTLQAFIMTGDDPATCELTELNCKIATAPSSGYSGWTSTGALDISNVSGIIYIGWRYYSEKGGSGGSTTYCLDNIKVGTY